MKTYHIINIFPSMAKDNTYLIHYVDDYGNKAWAHTALCCVGILHPKVDDGNDVFEIGFTCFRNSNISA